MYEETEYEEKFKKILNNEIKIKDLKECSIEYLKCMDIIYTNIFEYIGISAYKTSNYLKDISDCFIETKGKENDEILREIREDVINILKKDINYCLFEDKDFD